MTLQSHVAKAYMLSYIQQKSVEFYYVLQLQVGCAQPYLLRVIFVAQGPPN